jgi:hypothetical protein
MRLHSTLGAPFGGYEANREIVTIYFSPDGSPDAVDSAGAVVISGGDCIISSSRRTWSLSNVPNVARVRKVVARRDNKTSLLLSQPRETVERVRRSLQARLNLQS